MCGIAGMVGFAANADLVGRMTCAQSHRGPDADGLWSEPGVALGHRRLKIIDLSDAGRQPMSTADGRYTMVYNGEVYNYREIRSELSTRSYRSASDTEVVLQAFAEWGPAALDRFVGMYSLAIWDSHKQELFCARDRLGIKPFYFAVHDGCFLFSSEIHALFEAGVPRRVNNGVLYDYLARDFYEHVEETFFRDVQKLAPGHWMVVRPDQRNAQQHRYWSLAEESARIAVPAGEQEREEAFLARCEEAVDLHLRSDVPVGVTLSGGLDSATLLALLDKVHPDPERVEAFSFTFHDETYSERPFVEMMAQHTHRAAHFVDFSAKDFADTAQKYAISQEEPFGGAPTSAYTKCFELAREHGFIVVMDGSGMDEMLGGYARFLPARWADLFNAGNWAELDAELSAAGITTPAQRDAALAQMRAAGKAYADTGRGQDMTRSVRPECLTKDFVAVGRKAPPTFERPFNDNLRNLMYRELRYTKLPRALRFRDRSSMSVGTELRPPFLDHRLLAFAFALPAEDLIHRARSKVILRRAAARLLPDVVRLASKRSVQTPQREWFRGPLKDWIAAHVDTPSFWQRGWVDPKRGRREMDAFFRGEGDNSFFLWQWANLEIWARTTIDAPATSQRAVGV